MNAAEAGANQPSDLQSPVRPVRRPDQRPVCRRRVSKVHRRSRNVVGRQRENWARSQVRAKVDQGKFRRRGATEDLSVNDSARRRLPVQVNRISAAEVRRLDFVNRSRRRREADLQVKHAAKEKECRAPMGSPHRHNNNSSSSSSEAARLPQPIRANDRDSRKVGRKEHQKKRRGRGHNRSETIIDAAPEREVRSRSFSVAAAVSAAVA